MNRERSMGETGGRSQVGMQGVGGEEHWECWNYVAEYEQTVPEKKEWTGQVALSWMVRSLHGRSGCKSGDAL